MSTTDTSELLPDGWARCSIGQVTLPTTKINPKIDKDREVQYIDISSIDNRRHVVGNTKRFKLRHAPSRARQIVHSGDTLFSTVRPYLRNIAIVPSSYDQEIASTGFSVLRPATGISPKFLFYKTISSDFVDRVSGMQYGVSYPAVKDEQVRDQELWLPPTAEQDRIVKKINELFSEIEASVERLQIARAQLGTYRQVVLKHAFEGKLTKKWREENKEGLRTAEQLMSWIRHKRAEKDEQRLRDWHTAIKAWEERRRSGDKPKRPKTLPTVTGLSHNVTSTLPALADSWFWAKLAWMTCGVDYGTAAKSAPTGAVPVLRMGNIRGGQFDWSDLVYSSDGDEVREVPITRGRCPFQSYKQS